ncbi:MMPL family transporter [Cryptosporangium arvum]|uniref:Putative RND superfamily drug exporter n=1 Tax=Cryptosporangium arvum DSM 44712 TaxID=927661 RepID=A0A011AK64_9ACTN|nr:MMPL family transporter [Cryptosporangium arvum]EXG82361.1 putative RND superfamily drug exporter [Cryptosporangium arvum DSM 44712]
MATLLYRIGRLAFRRRRWIAAAWLAVLAATLFGASALEEPTKDSFTIPGTQSQQAMDLLAERFPEASAGGATARVVFAAPDGETLRDPAYRRAIDTAVAELKQSPQVAAVADPFSADAVNEDGTIGFAEATYEVPGDEVSDGAHDALTSVLERARAGGLRVEAGGDAVAGEDEGGFTEIIGVVVAAVVLAITFGSLIAAGLPLLTAILGIAIGIGVITAASGFVDLSSETPTLALMLGLAVAIDYALFIVSRYRHELSAGREREDAVGRAVGTAGSAVVFAGLTVIIALAALAVVGIPFLTQMGLAAAFTVAVSVVIALTLLPALLGFAGRRIRGDRKSGQHTHFSQTYSRPTLGARWVRMIARRPLAVLLLAVIGLGVVALPTLDMRLGLGDDSTASEETTQGKAYDLLSEGFGPGFNGPLIVVVDARSGTASQAAEQVATRIHDIDDVGAVADPAVNEAGDTAILTVIPDSGPSTDATKNLVRAIRQQDGLVPGATIAVTGLTALNIDISTKLGDALIPYLAVVVGLAFILLTLVFRSVLVPLKATAGFLLSVAATFGAVVAVFQKGWFAGALGVDQVGPITSFLPIILIGIVFGLAMDYQVFLVTRMREEYVHGAPARSAVIGGFEHGARVVTAAAIIMISVFSGFVLAPAAFIKSIGFALGTAVLFDALIVRMTIVPAAMILLGKSAWWLPRWLDRLLPDVDVEGEKLRSRLDGAPQRVRSAPVRVPI